MEGGLILPLGVVALCCELLFVEVWTTIALLVGLLIGWSEDSARPVAMITGRAVLKKNFFSFHEEWKADWG